MTRHEAMLEFDKNMMLSMNIIMVSCRQGMALIFQTPGLGYEGADRISGTFERSGAVVSRTGNWDNSCVTAAGGSKSQGPPET